MKPLKRVASELYHYDDEGRRAAGAHSGLSGDCTGLSGDCTGLSGDCTGLRGDLSDIPACARPCGIAEWAE